MPRKTLRTQQLTDCCRNFTEQLNHAHELNMPTIFLFASLKIHMQFIVKIVWKPEMACRVLFIFFASHFPEFQLFRRTQRSLCSNVSFSLISIATILYFKYVERRFCAHKLHFNISSIPFITADFA